MRKEIEVLRAYMENFGFLALLNQEYMGVNVYPGELPLETRPKERTEEFSIYSEEERTSLERIYLAIQSQLAKPIVKCDQDV